MLVCRAKSAQTPYQFGDLIDPAGRQSLLAFGSPVNELIRHCVVSALGTVHARRNILLERAAVFRPDHHSDSSQKRGEESVSKFYGTTPVT